MLIARVIGELVATQKHASHEGRKLLLVQPLNLDGTDRGDAVVALDAVDAGVGDKVLLTTEGFSAMTSVGRPNSPIDMAVIGFIDDIDLRPGVGWGSRLPARLRSDPRPLGSVRPRIRPIRRFLASWTKVLRVAADLAVRTR
jgi:ethanolamine utilization protein EutN